MNSAILMGRLTRDPEVRYSQTNMPIARYTLAVDRRGGKAAADNQQTADFINIVAFDKAADFAQKYFHQGMRVLVSGRIQTGSYTNKDGMKVNTFEIVASSQEFADGKSDGKGTATSATADSTIGDGFMNIPDSVEEDDLPFN